MPVDLANFLDLPPHSINRLFSTQYFPIVESMNKKFNAEQPLRLSETKRTSNLLCVTLSHLATMYSLSHVTSRTAVRARSMFPLNFIYFDKKDHDLPHLLANY